MQCITGNCSACLRVALNAICTTPLAALLGTDWLRFDWEFWWEEIVARGGRWRKRETDVGGWWDDRGRASVMYDVITIREFIMYFLSLVSFPPSLPWPSRDMFSLDHASYWPGLLLPGFVFSDVMCLFYFILFYFVLFCFVYIILYFLF